MVFMHLTPPWAVGKTGGHSISLLLVTVGKCLSCWVERFHGWKTQRVSWKKSLPWHANTEIFSLIQGFMSCGLLNIGCIRGMFVLMLSHCLLFLRNPAVDGPFVSFQMESLLLSRLVLAACGDFSSLSAQLLLGFSDAVTGDGSGTSGTAVAKLASL